MDSRLSRMLCKNSSKIYQYIERKEKRSFKEPSPKLEYAEGLLRDRLSTKVKLLRKKITVSYTGIDDLNRVLDLMGALEKVKP